MASLTMSALRASASFWRDSTTMNGMSGRSLFAIRMRRAAIATPLAKAGLMSVTVWGLLVFATTISGLMKMPTGVTESPSVRL